MNLQRVFPVVYQFVAMRLYCASLCFNLIVIEKQSICSADMTHSIDSHYVIAMYLGILGGTLLSHLP